MYFESTDGAWYYKLIMNILKLISLLSLLVVFQSRAQYTVHSAPLSQPNDTIFSLNGDSLTQISDSIQGNWSHLTINSDSRINKLMDIATEESHRKEGIDGYRVQIFKGDKNNADRIRAEFLKAYPDFDVYLIFQTPDFRVRIGDFRTRSEAIRLKHQIERDFPNPIIVDDVINFPRLNPSKR